MTTPPRTVRRDRLRVHLRLIDAGVAPVVEVYREHIQCAAGCSSCCSQVFAITEIEAETLLDGLAASPEPIRREVLRRARGHQPGEPCPALDDDGRCRLYEHRPRICRKYGIPLWHPARPDRVDTCALNFRGVVDLDPDLIVEPQAKWAADWIELCDELELGQPRRETIATWIVSAADDSSSAHDPLPHT